MNARRLAVAIALIAAAVMSLQWSPQPATQTVRAARHASTTDPQVAAGAVFAVRPPGVSASPEKIMREDSLRDTAIDGAVNLDAHGRPLADRELRRLFDYFLARLGERGTEQIRDDVLAHVRDALHLDASAQAQVLEWFDAYVAAARAETELSRSNDVVADATRLRALHRERLGEALARAWFGDGDDYAAYTAQRLAIEHDTGLSAQDKSRRLTDLEATLDHTQTESLQATTDFQIAVAQSRELDANGADASSRFAERSALWGEAAAARLAALDQAESEWNSRVMDYARARATVLAKSGLTSAAQAAQLDALLAGFSEPEQRRLLSLAQANALP